MDHWPIFLLFLTHFTFDTTVHLLYQWQTDILFLLSFCRAEVAPYLQGVGQAQQVVLEGNRLVLTCPAGGSWPLHYRWTLNNSNITDWTLQNRSACTASFLFCPIFVIISLWKSYFLPSFSPARFFFFFTWLVTPVTQTNNCSIKALHACYGVCLEKVRAFRQQSQSEINTITLAQ